MIKVQRTSPDYLATQFVGDCEALSKDIAELGVVCQVSAHTRIGDTEALYAMVEIEGQDSTIFLQKSEWILFNDISKTYVTTSSNYAFRYNFAEIANETK